MKIFLPLLLLIGLFASNVFAQTAQTTVTPTPKPITGDDDIVKISTSLIQIDVTVTDENGKPVTDLKPGDFEVLENNKKQEITNFSFVSPSAAPSSLPTKMGAKNQIANFPIKPEQVRRTVALVVDDLSLAIENIYFVRKSLRKFVDEQMRDGDLVAILRTGGGSGALQQFTFDRRQLSAAIERIRLNPFGRNGAVLPIGASTANGANATGLRTPEQEANNFRESTLATNAINNLSYVISGMKNLPGRKSVILLSEGFKVIKIDIVGKEKDYRVAEALEKLFDTASRSSVVVYTIDVRGLQPEIDDDFKDQQSGLTYLAQQTGGLAFRNNNDFNLGIEKSLEDQKGFYLVGYAPGAESFDLQTRRFNKLTVKINRPGLRVRYRSGFFGVSDEAAQPAKLNRNQQITAALNSPFNAGGIDLRLNTLLGKDSKAGVYLRSLLHVEARDLQFSQSADGTHQATFDILAISVGGDGKIADQVSRNYTLILKEENYREILRDGFVYNFVFPVKKSGAYQLRVALRDSASAKIGSASQFIEIPDLRKGELTVSGIVLENLSPDLKTVLNSSAPKNTAQADTSLRRFKRGTILQYGFEIYNAKSGSAQTPQLIAQTKVFREDKLLFAGKQIPIDTTNQPDLQNINSSGVLTLGKDMLPGDYLLQIIVTDNLAKGKNKMTAQTVQFEIVE